MSVTHILPAVGTMREITVPRLVCRICGGCYCREVMWSVVTQHLCVVASRSLWRLICGLHWPSADDPRASIRRRALATRSTLPSLARHNADSHLIKLTGPDSYAAAQQKLSRLVKSNLPAKYLRQYHNSLHKDARKTPT